MNSIKCLYVKLIQCIQIEKKLWPSFKIMNQNSQNFFLRQTCQHFCSFIDAFTLRKYVSFYSFYIYNQSLMIVTSKKILKLKNLKLLRPQDFKDYKFWVKKNCESNTWWIPSISASLFETNGFLQREFEIEMIRRRDSEEIWEREKKRFQKRIFFLRRKKKLLTSFNQIAFFFFSVSSFKSNDGKNVETWDLSLRFISERQMSEIFSFRSPCSR